MTLKKTTGGRVATRTSKAKAPNDAFAPDIDETFDDDDTAALCAVTGPRNYVLRTGDGRLLHEVSDFVIANQLARALGVRVKVFKRTPDGEVLLSHSGPGKWD